MVLVVVVIILTIVVVLVITRWVVVANAYAIIDWWNRRLYPHRQRQNAAVTRLARRQRVVYYTPRGLREGACPPGLTHAEASPHPAVRLLHRLIDAARDDIRREVQALVARGYAGVPMVSMDATQRHLGIGAAPWRPIWVRFLRTWAGTAAHLPTLRGIVARLGDRVSLLHVSVFGSGTELPTHRGISMGVLRYHYALSIPPGDTGMSIGGVHFQWQPGRGYAFDDTYPHSAWNRTAHPRWVIFADLPRVLPCPYAQLNRAVHHLIEYTRHVKSIADRLAKEGIGLD